MAKPIPMRPEEVAALQKAVGPEDWDRLVTESQIQKPKGPRGMTCKEAMAELELALTTLRQHMKSGRIRVLRVEKRKNVPTIIVSAEDVEQYAYERRAKKDAGEKRRIDWLNRPL